MQMALLSTPLTKKAVSFVDPTAQLDPLRLSAVSVSSELSHLPSMAGGYMNELHEL